MTGCAVKCFQPRFGPITHRHHDCLSVHLKLASFVELETPLPSVAKAVRPFAGVTVSLVPNEFLSPQPALLAQSESEFDDKCMTFPVFDLFFDIQDESATWFEHTQELCAAWDEPTDIFLRWNPTVRVLAAICIRWRSDYQIEGVIRKFPKHLQAVTSLDFRCGNPHGRVARARISPVGMACSLKRCCA